jgi:hypothetical protein
MLNRCLVITLCVVGWSVGAAAQDPGNGRLTAPAKLLAVNPPDTGTVSASLVADDPASAGVDSTPVPAASAASVDTPSATSETTSLDAERRACDGCPQRSVGKAFAHTTIINGFYGLANLIRGQETAKITPKTWWSNMQDGWVWDLDDFTVNQFGHPYQGNNYFNAARSNGLSFWESTAVTAFGSGTWEYFGETNRASLNDLINTTLGGIALGEMFHRTAWLVRDTHKTGKSRLWSEIGASALDPITGVNRFISGDSSRVSDKPSDMVPSSLAGFGSMGALWRGDQKGDFDGTPDPFLEMDMLYGDVERGRSRTPYDAFAFRLRLGGGAGISEAKVRGRLVGEPLGDGKLQFAVLQDYEYEKNDVFHTGAQSFEASLSRTWGTAPGARLLLLGWGGLTVLGAVDSLPVDLEAPPPEQENSVQGVSEGPRYYDYGPGSLFGATAIVTRNQKPLLTAFYEGRQLYSLDGVRANHFLQRFRLDLIAPVRGPLGIGVTGEFFDRHTYYQDANRTVKHYYYPQISAYLSWRIS